MVCRAKVTLFSRHKKVLNRRFSSVVQALASLGGDFVSRRKACRFGFTRSAFITTYTIQSFAGSSK